LEYGYRAAFPPVARPGLLGTRVRTRADDSSEATSSAKGKGKAAAGRAYDIAAQQRRDERGDLPRHVDESARYVHHVLEDRETVITGGKPTC